jgi:hypothetical protein
MDALAIAGSLMALALASGVRLYTTVLAVGLGIRFGFLDPPEQLNHLRVLAELPVLIVAGIVYVVEFVADKIPWVDTLWDTIHTFVRPLGAAIIAATALGPVDPGVKVAATLLAGGVAFTGHSAKAGTRLVVNQSPEPFSNIGLSVAEDGFVLGSVWLAFTYPMVALTIALVIVALTVWLLPKLFRLVRRQAGRIRALMRHPFARSGSS